MVNDAEANREADKVRRELVEARNAAQSTIGAVERQISEGTDLDQTLVDAVNAAKIDLQSCADNVNATAEEIRAANAKLMDAAIKVGQSRYA